MGLDDKHTLSTGIEIECVMNSELVRVIAGSEVARFLLVLRFGKVIENLPPTAVVREMFMPYGQVSEKVRMSGKQSSD